MNLLEQPPPTSEVLQRQAEADAVRALRLLITQIEAAGDEGLTLRGDSPLVELARQYLEATPEERATTRTALMALRDLVWRVDAVRYVFAEKLEPEAGTALHDLFDTSDIHTFLAQEP